MARSLEIKTLLSVRYSARSLTSYYNAGLHVSFEPYGCAPRVVTSSHRAPAESASEKRRLIAKNIQPRRFHLNFSVETRRVTGTEATQHSIVETLFASAPKIIILPAYKNEIFNWEPEKKAFYFETCFGNATSATHCQHGQRQARPTVPTY